MEARTVRIVISPYHLTTREIPAMAALLLADQAVTMIPAPLAEFGPADLHRAVEGSPRYLKFMESWAWTLPLWRAGVLASAFNGQDATADVHHAWSLIDNDDDFAPLRPLMRRTLFDDDREYMDALAGDLLKGGPDPGISVPMAAGLDRFASRHKFLVARAEAFSIAQKAEARMGEKAFALAVPVLARGSAGRLLLAREVLATPLRSLRDALDSAAESALSAKGGTPDRRGGDALQHAAGAYANAFDQHRAELTAPDEEERAVEGFVALTALLLPGDAVLHASLAAVKTLGIPVARRTVAATTLPARSDPLRVGRFVSVVIRTIGRSR